MSELVRRAIDQMLMTDQQREDDVDAIRAAAGAWSDRSDGEALDGAAYVEGLRSGRRLNRR